MSQHIPAVKAPCLGDLVGFYSYDNQVALFTEHTQELIILLADRAVLREHICLRIGHADILPL